MRQNPHVRICGGPGSATTLVYPTLERGRYMIGSTTWGVGALIQRGGRAVAGMLTIATAGGS